MIEPAVWEGFQRAVIRRDIPAVEAALRGEDLALRRAALRAVRTLPVSDDAVAGVLEDAPLELRKALYRTLRSAKRSALADRLLPEVRTQWGDAEAAVLLAACSRQAVTDGLADLAYAVGSWSALAERHPGAVLDHFEDDLGSPLEPATTWYRRRAPALAILAETSPERVMGLLERLRGSNNRYLGDLPAAMKTALGKADPIRAFPLIGDMRQKSLDRHGRAVAQKSDAAILEDARDDADFLGFALMYVHPDRREALVDAFLATASADVRDDHMEEFLNDLPAERAAAEAQRLLARHDAQWHSERSQARTDTERLALVSRLPADQAVPMLLEASTSPITAVRQSARSLLLTCAARTGDPAQVLARVEELLPRVLSERDPVRRSFAGALSTLPVKVFSDAWVPTLERLTMAMLDAHDASEDSRSCLRNLAGRTLRHQDSPLLVDWALTVYRDLVARFGAAGLAVPAPEDLVPPPGGGRRRRYWNPPQDDWRLDLVLKPGQEHALVALLRPWLASDPALVTDLRRALGRRAAGLDGLGTQDPGHGSRGGDTPSAAGPRPRSADPAGDLASFLAAADDGPLPAGDSAAFAAFAANCARVRPSALGPILEDALFAPHRKVVTRKSAIRELRRNRVPGHVDILLRAWHDPGLHPDVRAAAAAVLRHVTEDPRALEALSASVETGLSDRLVRVLFQPNPYQFPAPARPVYAALVRRLLRASSDPGVRFRGTKALLAWTPWLDLDQCLGEYFDAIAGDDPAEAAVAEELIKGLIRGGDLDGQVPGLLRRLISDPALVRRANALTEAVAAAGRPALAEQVLAVLAPEPAFRRQAVETALTLTDDADPDTLARHLGTVADLLADRPFLAGTLWKPLAHRLRYDRDYKPRRPGHFRPALEALAGRDDPASGLLACVVANAVAGMDGGLPEFWDDLVDTLAGSPHAEVSAAASDLKYL